MNALRTSFALRAATVVVAFFAWVVLSNHCALSAAFTVKSSPTAAEEPSCCKQSKPADEDAPCPQMPQGCCKTLKVAMPDGAKVPQASSLGVVALPIEWPAAFTLALPEPCAAAAATDPPPDSPTFAE